MEIAVSLLDCKDRVKSVLNLNKTNIGYCHIDVMDGNFVPNNQFEDIKEIVNINSVANYPLDVHLMVENPIDYIKKLGHMNIEFITIHLEIDIDKMEVFKSIRNLGYKVGLSIKPKTSIKELEPYLDDIDLILVMSVEPGIGGQKFIEETVDRIKELKELINKCGRNILIEVDGGVNKETITKLDGVDIAVVGSYITKSDDYCKSVNELFVSKEVDACEIIMDDNIVSCKIKEKQILYSALLGISILGFIVLIFMAIFIG